MPPSPKPYLAVLNLVLGMLEPHWPQGIRLDFKVSPSRGTAGGWGEAPLPTLRPSADALSSFTAPFTGMLRGGVWAAWDLFLNY